MTKCGLAYLMAAETDENVVFNCVPRPSTAAMIATAMPAAIRPYSMAVAPVSFFRKRKKAWSFDGPPC